MAEKKTNVVMILTDDQGIWSLGCYGNQEIKTPNLDRLAETGVRFNNFFCTSPVCSPARASLLTGKIPSQHGIHDYLSGGNGGATQEAIEFLKDHRGYTDILADNGYTCGISGKWHLGDGIHQQKGFSFWYVHQKGGGPYYDAPMIRNGELVNEPGYVTDNITKEAIGFIEREKDHPFYLSVHYTAPHSPWIDCHPKQYTDLYEDCIFESCPQEEAHPWAKTELGSGFKHPRESLIGYFAAVTAMDENVGRILDKLEVEGLVDNTLVIFTSDNGFNCGHHGIWGKGNGTFPLNMYDYSVKVPFIMNHPGRIPEHTICDDMCSGYDFMPTLLEYLGIEGIKDETLPGKSFLPGALNGGMDPDRSVVVFDEYGPVRMIRDRRYKFIRRYPFGPDEFYDLVDDPGEKHNRLEDERYLSEVCRIRHQLESWFVKYVDPRVDGVKEPVMGGGQKNLAGILGPGVHIYAENL